MTGEDVPEAVRELLRDHVETYEQLGTLLYARAQGDRAFSADEAAAAVGLASAEAEAALLHLVGHSLVGVDKGPAPPRYRYGARSSPQAPVIDQLATVHDRQHLGLVRQMSANAIERMRTSAARAFSEAFVLRREKK